MTQQKKAQITYPCNWTYKIIGLNKKSMIDASQAILNHHSYSLKDSNSSKSGKYISLEINLIVQNEEQRNNIYKEFVQHESIKMVI
ncbi:MAG: DUF493 domain-containing protein [Fibrobacter sp.]|nr:DUF493 domain-containing protein [Fibrobacter sp.]